jgi:hypothetical protein
VNSVLAQVDSRDVGVSVRLGTRFNRAVEQANRAGEIGDMFVLAAFAATALIAWWVDRKNYEDRRVRPSSFDDGEVRQSVVHTRQDVKLITFLLIAILLMLGVIADLISGK